jgi:Tfp pilus assembly protein, ATPase PilU
MVELVVGKKGSGKTKKMVDMINTAAQTSHGNIVCIERNMKLTYDIDHSVRLIDVEEYRIEGYDMLYGFVSGVLAGNYDIQEVYIDGTLRVTNYDIEGLGGFLDKLDALTDESIKMVVTISADETELPPEVMKHI